MGVMFIIEVRDEFQGYRVIIKAADIPPVKFITIRWFPIAT